MIWGFNVATNKAKAANPLADMMSQGGLSDITGGNDWDVTELTISDIKIRKQIRQVMESEEQTIADLWASIEKNGQLQAIVVRPNPFYPEEPEPYELVIGERRVLSFVFGGREKIQGSIREMTDAEAEDAQEAENVDRLNLALIEEANKLKRDLDACGGDIEQLVAKRQKSRAWISKRLSILDLPAETKRLVTEKVTADHEVINDVKQIEKIDPVAAAQTVDAIKEAKKNPETGKTARKIASEAKASVKPPTKAAQAKKAAGGKPPSSDTNQGKKGGDAKPPAEDKGAMLEALNALNAHNAAADGQASGSSDAVDSFTLPPEPQEKEPPMDAAKIPLMAPVTLLDDMYEALVEHGLSAANFIKHMPKEEHEECENWLHSIYDAGVQAKNLGRTVMLGHRSGQFAFDGHGALTLAAFLYGTEGGVKFNFQDVVASVAK